MSLINFIIIYKKSQLVDILWSVIFQPDDRGPQHADSVRLEFPDQGKGIGAAEFTVPAISACQPHPGPRDPHLDELIDGIGAKRKKALLTFFGSVADIKKASIEELQKVEGVSQSFAKKVYDYFH